MSAVITGWWDLRPVRGAMSELDPSDRAVWADRLRFDIARLEQNQTPELAAITKEVVSRSRSLGAAAVVLTGSTARARRTLVSDLDYHVIGARPSLKGLSEDIDLYADSPEEFSGKLRSGDDFAHWSVWYGCIVFDALDVMSEGASYIAGSDAWPDPDRKRKQAAKTLDFARDLIESGDYGAGLEQTRGALSLAARWWLLVHGVFPLARDELSSQLRATGEMQLADDLRASIHNRPEPSALRRAIEATHRLLTPVHSGMSSSH